MTPEPACRTGKHRHPTKEEAMSHLHRMRRDRVKGHAGLNCYRCRDCGDWHVGNVKGPAVRPGRKEG